MQQETRSPRQRDKFPAQPAVADAAADVVDRHLYTLNTVGATGRWRKGFLGRLAS